MTGPELRPERIKTPIQLLAVWFAVMVIVSGSFLVGATTIPSPAWIATMLSIAAVAVVPVFLVCGIVMQTKFRAELQEDRYYLDWVKWQDSRLEAIKREASAARRSLPAHAESRGSELETVNGAIRAIEQVASLTSTEAKILAMLADAPSTYVALRRDLIERYGSETRAATVKQLLARLAAVGLIAQRGGETYELTPDGHRVAAAYRAL